LCAAGDDAANKAPETPETTQKPPYKTLSEIKSDDDLFGPGAKPGTVPTDLEQATGLERLELLGKMEGVDIFDMKPLDASRRGTVDNPILFDSFGEEAQAGCTGFPAGSHQVKWCRMTLDRPVERCMECGNVYKLNYVGPPLDHDEHHHYHHNDPYAHPYHGEPKTFADYVDPKYWGR